MLQRVRVPLPAVVEVRGYRFLGYMRRATRGVWMDYPAEAAKARAVFGVSKEQARFPTLHFTEAGGDLFPRLNLLRVWLAK